MRNNWLGLMATALLWACSGAKLELGVQEQSGGANSESGGSAGRSSGGRATTGGASAGRGGSAPLGGQTTTGGSSENRGGGSVGGAGGFAPPSAWDELTLTESGGFTAPPGEGSECSLLEYESAYTVTSASNRFAFDLCDGTREKQMIRRGGFTLTAEELAEAERAVSVLEPGRVNACGADKPTILLDIEAPSRTYQLADDFYACAPNPNNRIFVGNIDPLADLLRGWARSVARPDAKAITLTSLGGGLQPPPQNPNPACDSRTHVDQYVADLEAGTFSWDLCPSYALNQGIRALDDAEIDSVNSAYRALRTSTRSLCGADKSVLLAHIDTSEGPLDYADDFYSCHPAPPGAQFVSNIDELYSALATLVPR